MLVNQSQHMKCLRRVGMVTFVKHYNLFADKSLSDVDVVNELKNKEHEFKDSSCRTKTYNARKIIREEGVNVALEAIVNASKVPQEWVLKAEVLLDRYNKNK